MKTSSRSSAPARKNHIGTILSSSIAEMLGSRKTHLALSGTVAALMIYQFSDTKASAASETWVGAVSADWAAAEWTPNASLAASADTVTFNAAGAAGATLSNTGTFSIAGMTFGSTASSYTMGGNAITLTAGGITDNSTAGQAVNLPIVLGANSAVTVGASETLTLGGILSESVAATTLTKSGAGTLVLGANNTYTGNTILDGGTLTYTVANTGVKQLTFGLAANSANVSSLNVNDNVTATGLLARTGSASANTISIASGKTLTINGATTIGVATQAAPTVINFTGAGSLVAGSGASNFDVSPASPTTANSVTMDMSGLNSFTFSSTGSFRVGVGDFSNANVTLAGTSNAITATTFIVGGQANTSNNTLAALHLGAGTNTINATTINVSDNKSKGLMDFASGTGTLKIRGTGGTNADRANITIGSRGASGATAATGTVTLTGGHVVDILANSLIIGRSTGANTNEAGTLSFDAGTVDVTSIQLGVRTNGGVTGTFNVGGGVVKVGSGGIHISDSATTTGVGILNINGGSVQTNGDIVKGTSTGGLATLAIQGGTLDMLDTNAVTRHSIGGSGAAAINTLTLASGTLKNVNEINGGAAITKTTAGTLILDGTNSYTGATNVTGGTLQIGNGGATGTAGTGGQISLSTGTVLAFNRTGTLTVGNKITSAGAVQQNGSGTTVLSNATNDYTGATDINNGTLAVTGVISGTSAVNVNTGSTLSGSGTISGTTVTMVGSSNLRPGADGADGSTGTLTLSNTNLSVGGGNMRFDLGGTSDLVNLTGTGTGTFTGSTTIGFNVTGVLGSSYTLVSSANDFVGTGFLSVSTPNIGRSSFALNLTDTKAIKVDVTATVGNISWRGTVDAGGGTYLWDVTSTANWDNAGSPDKFFNGDNVTFDNAGVNKTVTLNTSVTPLSVTDSSTGGNNYTISGSGGIIGATGLTKSGNSTLTLGGTNTFSGGTAVQNGTLKAASTGALSSSSTVTLGSGSNSGVLDLNGFSNTVGGLATSGSGTGNIITNGGGSDATLTYASGTSTFSGVIQDGGTNTTALTVASGALTLTGTNTYTGATTMNGGTLTFSSLSNLGSGTALNFGGGTLKYAGGTTTDISSRTVTINAGGGTIDTNGNDVTFASAIGNGGTGGLTKAGTGKLTLMVANGYTGATAVNNGTLALGASDILADAAALNVGGGTLDMAGNSDTVGAVTLSSGSITGASSVLTGTSFAVQGGSVSAILAGGAALTKSTAGTVTLSGVNTYSGSTILNGGTLAYTTDNAVQGLIFGAAAGSANTSTLDLSAVNLTATSITARTNSATASTITVGSGKTLTTSGALTVTGLAADSATTKLTVTGSGGALSVNSLSVTSASLTANFPTDGTMSYATLDLSGLDNFTVGGGAVNIGVGNRNGGILNLAGVSNTITTTTLAIGTGGSSQGSNGTVNLGAGTNILNASTINVGTDKGIGLVAFSGGTGSVKIRGTGGTDADRANITLGNRSATGSNTTSGTLSFNGHSVDILADAMIIGKHSSNASGTTGSGSLSFDAGTVDANSIVMALRTSATNGVALGSLTVGGGLLNVRTGGFSLVNSTDAASTGTLNINGGTVQTDSNITEDAADVNAAGTSTINLHGGTLDMMTHNIGTTAAPINNLSFESGTLKNVGQINGGTGGFSKTSSGTLTLTGTNTYSGTTTITGGTLLANSTQATGTGSVSVGIAGTLGGTGSIKPTGSDGIIVAGKIAPGASIGTLTLDGTATSGTLLTMNAGSTLTFKLAIGSNDQILLTPGTANGAVNFAGATTISFTDQSGGFLDPGTPITLFDGQDDLQYTNFGNLTIDPAFLDTYVGATLSQSGGDILLTVPEPNTIATLLGGLGVLILRRKRDQRSA